MAVRNATHHDISALVPLLAELGYPSSVENLTARWNKFIGNPGYGVAVYEIDQQIVGLIAWSTTPLFVEDVTRFHIEGLIVSIAHRSQGVGKLLMAYVEEIAKRKSPSIVDLKTGMRRAKEGSHEFYKNLGYKNEGPRAKLYLRKEL